MSLWSAFLDLLFPPRCAFCQAVLDRRGDGVCPDCREHLPLADTLLRGPYGQCAVALWYEDMVRQGIHGLKFGGRSSAAQVFAPFLAQAAAEHLAGEFDTVSFVPVSRKRLRQRGYDQARLLAEALAAIWDTRAAPTLEKVRDTAAQSTLSAPEERRANVLGAYRALPGASVEGRRILLVDDVVTTGSTLAAARDALLLAGAASVVCAALAAPRSKKGKT